MNKILHLFWSTLLWNIQRVIWMVGFLLALGAALLFADEKSSLTKLLYFGVAGYSVFFYISLVNANRTSPAFRFLSALPMSRMDLLKFYALQGLVASLPFSILVWAPENGPFYFFLFLVLGTLMQLALVHNAIALPRVEAFQRKFQRGVRAEFQMWFSVICTFLAFAVFAVLRFDVPMSFLDVLLNFVIKPLEQLEGLLAKFALSWWAVLFLAVATYGYSKLIQRLWENEKSSYPIRLPRRLPFVIPTCAASLFALAFYLYVTPPFAIIDDKLLSAVHKGDMLKIRSLIDAGEDINQTNKYGLNALMIAAKTGNFELFKILHEKGAFINGVVKGQISNKGQTILTLAIDGKNEDLIKYILDSGYDLKKELYVNKNYPLHRSSRLCLTRTVDLLLAKGMDPHYSPDKKTALHGAVENKCYGATASLLSANVDPQRKNKDGKTAFDLTSDKEMKYFVEKHSRAPAALK